MRITGGRYRGRKVICPPGAIRPAMDRMRESMFSILGNISGLSFLDLFSGSGIVGIEAASRYAEPILLVEKDARKKKIILKNISFVEADIKPVFLPAERFVIQCKRQFDIIFTDPPFAYKFKHNLLASISKND
ncbi:MAG: RsmD family RNA methyltransferase, partial [Spirochaetota bacterium]